MSGDCQSQRLAEWLQSLGCSVQLSPSDLRTLNSPRMRSIWRHLQSHIVPTQTAAVIQKNVLLAKVKKDCIRLGKFGNFKISSVQQLSKAKEMFKTEDYIEKVKDEISKTEDKLNIVRGVLLKQTAEKECKRQNIVELEEKVAFLKMKLSRVIKDNEKFNNENLIASYLKSSKSVVSKNELNHQKRVVSNYVKNYKLTTDGDDHDDYVCEMLKTISELKPDSVFQSVFDSSVQALKQLKSLNSTSEMKGLFSVGNSSFAGNIRNLYANIIKNEVTICECRKKIDEERTELEKEKTILIKAISEADLDKCSTNNNEADTSSDRETVIELLERLLKQLGLLEKREKSKSFKLELEKECEDVENISLSILAEEEHTKWKKVEEKVSEVNEVAELIFNSFVDSEQLNTFQTRFSELSSNFCLEKRHKYEETNIITDEFTDTLLKEIEIFHKTPMVALLRRWEINNKLLPVDFIKEISNNPSLYCELLQSEPKNALVNVVEQFSWSLSINNQFQ